MDHIPLMELLNHLHDLVKHHQRFNLRESVRLDVLLQVHVGRRAFAKLVRVHAVQHQDQSATNLPGVDPLGTGDGVVRGLDLFFLEGEVLRKKEKKFLSD